VDLNGVGLFLPLIHARADATGSWTLNTTVPPGLSGLDALFLAGGQTDLGQFRVSLLEPLTFL
jgi:hypothetical protein